MRTDILDRKEDILNWIREKKPKSYIAAQLKCKPSTLNNYLEKMDIKYAGRQDWNKGKTSNNYIPAQEYAKKDFVKSYILKEKLIKEGIKEYRCEICGLTEWQNKPIPLELHHKDCNHFNNNFNNLQILCPNCHAQQEGNAGANSNHYNTQHMNKIKNEIIKEKKKICPICKKNEINFSSKMCIDCMYISRRLVERPDRETFKTLIRTIPFVQIGKKFGVSDNAIRKWCKTYNLPSKVSEIKQYSDEEWRKL